MHDAIIGKKYRLIDANAFNNWGLDKINQVLLGYLNESIEAQSARYLHAVLTTFTVEDFNYDPKATEFRNSLLFKNYVEAFPNYSTPDFQGKLMFLKNEYADNVRYLVSPVMAINPALMYTVEFKDDGFMLINTVSQEDLSASVEEIF